MLAVVSLAGGGAAEKLHSFVDTNLSYILIISISPTTRAYLCSSVQLKRGLVNGEVVIRSQ
jgi:hypothetical protein